MLQESESEPGHLLRLQSVTKRYGSFTANDSIDLAIRAGEIHAILGENGAGKSTLMKTIFGVHEPDEGEMFWKGAEVRIKNPGQARKLGIGMVFQHFSLFETISVAQNISLTVPVPLPELSRRILEKGEEYGLAVKPDALVHGMSVGERQRVEIIRCLMQEPELIILDEPTSVLPPPNVKQLFKTLRKLSDAGIAILFISHKLDDIRALCHSATILRFGKVTGTVDPKTASSKLMANLMIGSDIPHARHGMAPKSGRVRLAVNGLNYITPDPHAVNLSNISLEVRSGEILGVAGVSGNGQAALVKLLSGEEILSETCADRITLMGKPAGHLNPSRRRKIGLAFVPEERLGRGAAARMSLSNNSLLTGHRHGMVKLGLIRRSERDKFTQRCIDEMDVRTRGCHSLASSLSGGNLQKFIISREIQLRPKVLIVSQPTWGIDIGAAATVRQKLIDLRDTGTAVLIISEDLEELFEISDRLVVMFNGGISNPVRTNATNPEKIGEMMVGHAEPSRGAAA